MNSTLELSVLCLAFVALAALVIRVTRTVSR